MACAFCILLLLSTVRRREGLTSRSVLKAPLQRNMASQKSMRAFFQTTKASENAPNKKSRNDETEPVVKSTSHSASVGPSLGGREEDDTDTCSCPNGLTDERWKSILSKEFSKAYFKNLMAFIDEESVKFSVYPPKEQMFSAFNLCSFDQIKVRFLSSDLVSVWELYSFTKIIKFVRSMLYTKFLGGNNRSGSLPWTRAGPWSMLLSAEGSTNSTISSQHDTGAQGSRSLTPFQLRWDFLAHLWFLLEQLNWATKFTSPHILYWSHHKSKVTYFITRMTLPPMSRQQLMATWNAGPSKECSSSTRAWLSGAGWPTAIRTRDGKRSLMPL